MHWLERALRPAVAYGAAVSLSAFVLFSMQLFAGRVIVPVFGGSGGVWAVALSFFSFALLLGYGYAHVLTGRLALRQVQVAHLAIAVLVLLAMLLVPADLPSVAGAGAGGEALSVLVAFALAAGAPSFLLSATTPLLSAWYGVAARNPWWLFAASNAASFVALLCYPLLIEPLLPLSVQRVALTIGVALFVFCLAAIVVAERRSGTSASPSSLSAVSRTAPTDARDEGRTRRMPLWFAAAFVPAGLLTATTNFLATDLASAPLLWVGPLAVYLASFVVAFSEGGRRLLPMIDRLVPAAAVLLWLPFVAPVVWPAAPLIAVELASFAVLAMAIHGRLARSRPSVRRLTSFYLVIAVAGASATAAVAIVAPLVFADVYEYPLLLAGALGVLALFDPPTGKLVPDMRNWKGIGRDLVWRVAPYLIVVAVLLLAWGDGTAAGGIRLFVVGLVVLVVMATPRAVALVAPLVIIATIAISSGSAGATTQVHLARSFYGVSEVVLSGNAHVLYSGTTVHGLQFLDDRRDLPTTYYVEPGPLGEVVADVRARMDDADFGVVGLGSGTAAAYAQPGDSLTFFEIDPVVVEIAQDPALFTFVRDAAVVPTTIVGDGRILVEGFAADSLDVLVIDAFSSGNVPPHLLTREALQEFMRTVRPGGLLAFHVSNRYYDLAPALAATAAAIGLYAAQREYFADDAAAARLGAADSSWVVVGELPDVARMLERGWSSVPPNGPVLTDDYHDLTRLLRP